MAQFAYRDQYAERWNKEVLAANDLPAQAQIGRARPEP